MQARSVLCTLIASALLITACASLEPQNRAQSPSPRSSEPTYHEPLVANLNARSGSCGVERWSVKTGTDPDASQVNLNTPVDQTISYLIGLTPPNTPPADARVAPTELTTFVLDATLVEYKLESDSDYHLVIKDAIGNTMITEIPDPACVGAGSPFASGIQNARSEFDAKYTATTSFQSANIPVQLTGIGFFDFQHGQTGVAPNAIELHPVLNVVFNPSGGSNQPLVANFTDTVNGLTASFTNTSTDSNGTITSSSWAFGDGGTSTTTSPSHTYTAAGTYNVTLTVTDSGGAQNTMTQPVTVTSDGGGSTQPPGNPRSRPARLRRGQ